MIFKDNKNKPKRLNKVEPRMPLDRTFIVLALAVVAFFIFIWIFQLGNSYPNELMSNL